MNTLIKIMDPIFTNYNWQRISTDINNNNNNNNNNNIIKYVNSQPYDEYRIETLPRENRIIPDFKITVPINNVLYKKTFHNTNLNEVVNYLNMHLSYYAENNKPISPP